MDNYCPVCFHVTEEDACPFCATDIRIINKARRLERLSDIRNTPTALREALRLYHQMERPAAEVRVMMLLADFYLHHGYWQLAQHYLENVLALNAGGTRFFAATLRKLGGLVGRRGEITLAYHLLEKAERYHDPQAPIERLRLQIEGHRVTFKDVPEILTQYPDVKARAMAWWLEHLARQDANQTGYEIEQALRNQHNDDYTRALLHRAYGIWKSSRAQHHDASSHLTSALKIFHAQHDLYEAARTQVDLARAALYEPASDYWPEAQTAVLNAQRLLGQAVTTLRKLGAHPADSEATALARTLAIGRDVSLPRDTTASAVGLIWVSMDGDWSDESRERIMAAAHKGGGLAEMMLGGLLVLHGLVQPLNDIDLVAENALGIAALLRHERSQHDGGPRQFRVAVTLGMLPQVDHDVTMTLRAIRQTELFKRARSLATLMPTGEIYTDDNLHLATHAQYHFEAVSPDSLPGITQAWWHLSEPFVENQPLPTLSRPAMLEYEDIFNAIDGVLERFKMQKYGGLVAIEGVAGTGKSRLLALLIQEIKKSGHVWLIHLRGDDALQHQPFGAMRHWLGREIPLRVDDPGERRLAHIATFRRSLLGLLGSGLVLLVIDDVHLLDTGSLATLNAVLPLMDNYPLLMLMSARPEGNADWQKMVNVASNAIPERVTRVTLPSHLAKIRSERIEDTMARRVLECAAVLGKRFSPLALRLMANVPDVAKHLANFQNTKMLAPTEKSGEWRFVQSAERDLIYDALAPDYRALLHWYALEALRSLNLPSRDHACASTIPSAAFGKSLEDAAAAMNLDLHTETLFHLDRSLSFYPGQVPPVDLILSRVGALLSLGQWGAAQETLNFLKDTTPLLPRDDVRRLLYQGELFLRVGEISSLFELYQEATEKLSYKMEASDDIRQDQIRLLYAQALARFKRGEFEIARSTLGGSLALAEKMGLTEETTLHWELLARIHGKRGEYEKAKTAIDKALSIRREMGYHWLLAESLEMSADLMFATGQMELAAENFNIALPIREDVGDTDAAIRMRFRLSIIANYRGDFGEATQQLRQALILARFSNAWDWHLELHTGLAEAYAQTGNLPEAFHHTHQALEFARNSNDRYDLALANIILAVVTLRAGWMDKARTYTLAATQITRGTENHLLRLRLHQLQMEIALRSNDDTTFIKALRDARNITPMLSHKVIAAKIALLAARFKFQKGEFNNAAREAERAEKIFAESGALHWQRQAATFLAEIADAAPQYVRREQRQVDSNT